MKKLLLLSILLTGCEGTLYVNPFPKAWQNNSHADALDDYTDREYMVRDLTDEEIDKADNAPGSGYHDSVVAAQDAALLAYTVIDLDDGTTIYIDDEDDVIIIEGER